MNNATVSLTVVAKMAGIPPSRVIQLVKDNLLIIEGISTVGSGKSIRFHIPVSKIYPTIKDAKLAYQTFKEKTSSKRSDSLKKVFSQKVISKVVETRTVEFEAINQKLDQIIATLESFK